MPALLALLALLAVAAWAVADVQIDLATLIGSAQNVTAFASRMFPLDFPPLGELLRLTGQTMSIVVCATMLSVALSVGMSVLGAANTTPHWSVRLSVRAVTVVARAVPDVVLAIVFFRLFGFGALPGVLAMGLHSVGMVGKLYADAVEQIDEGPRTALRASGAGRWQELASGVLPQVLPAFVATALHRLDINLRISVLLGFVGVEGLGYAIATSLEQLDYRRGMALAMVVIILCVVVELASGAIRRVLLQPKVTHRAPDTPEQVRPHWTLAEVRKASYAICTVLILLVALWSAHLSLTRFVSGLGDLGRTLTLFWPLEFLPGLLGDLWVTVQIALAATLVGAVLAVPIGALAARNVAPSAARVVRQAIVCVRGIPELVLAIMLVVITGLGTSAGVLALAVGAIGLLGKLVADSLEEVDPAVEQALRATGAGRWQVFLSATLPQAAPAVMGHVLYQLDVNVRAAALLGIVGAGGIGFQLLNASRVQEFGVVTAVVVLVFATVLLIELFAAWIRRVVR